MARPLSTLLTLATILLAAPTLMAQLEGSFELSNGRKIPAETVKPTANGFTAEVMEGALKQTLNFTANDVINADISEVPELAKARNQLASGKADAAMESVKAAERILEPYRKLQGSGWVYVVLLKMESLSMQGKGDEAAAIGNFAIDSGLPEDYHSVIRNFQKIVATPSGSLDERKAELIEIANQALNPWVSARVWLEIGALNSRQGKIEEAIKAWLRVPVFHPAESDLAVRGLIQAARGLQQLKRPEDGEKLLEDYLSDHLITPFADTLNSELLKLNPNRNQTKVK